MKVLIPFDISGIISGNPFDTELIRGLEFSGCDVDYGRFRLMDSRARWDVVNFQWPEYILPSKVPSQDDFHWLEEKLKEISLRSKIVCTVHNELPHLYKSDKYERLYKLLYRYADGFVHMGRVSFDKLYKRFYQEVSAKSHVIIPHGNYKIFGPKCDKLIARTRNGLPDVPLALVVGAIRHNYEMSLVMTASREMKRNGGRLIFAGHFETKKTSLNSFSSLVKRGLEEVYQHIRPFTLRFVPGIIPMPGRVPTSTMAELVSAVDIMIIPRLNALNSGNVPLGFTYGTVVAGPAVGNIGEILEKYDNPVFNPLDGGISLKKAIEEGLLKANAGLGLQNERIASEEWDWVSIGRSYKEFYDSLLKGQVRHV